MVFCALYALLTCTGISMAAMLVARDPEVKEMVAIYRYQPAMSLRAPRTAMQKPRTNCKPCDL